VKFVHYPNSNNSIQIHTRIDPTILHSIRLIKYGNRRVDPP